MGWESVRKTEIRIDWKGLEGWNKRRRWRRRKERKVCRREVNNVSVRSIRGGRKVIEQCEGKDGTGVGGGKGND